MDYNLLAGNSKALNSKQNGGSKDDQKLEMSMEDNYVSPVQKKANNKR